MKSDSRGKPSDEAEIVKVLHESHPGLRIPEKRWVKWLPSGDAIVRSFTGGVGGEQVYLSVFKEQNAKWQLVGTYLVQILN